jgi:uroporphyrinogen-III synthase
MLPASTSLAGSLAGKRILVTRPRAQAAALGHQLAALGAEPIFFPTIEIAPLEDYAALDHAIGSLSRYRWIIFTSVNGVVAFWKRLGLAGRQDLPDLKVAAIGPATAQALAQRGVRAHFIPAEYVAEAIAEGIGDVTGQWVLLPRADIAREALAVELGRRGAIVHETAAYRTLPAPPDPHGLAELRRGVDAITFTSSSTVRNFVLLIGAGRRSVEAADDGQIGRPGLPALSLGRAAMACLGPITAQTAREVGLPVDVVAKEYTVEGLVAALAEYFSRPELQLKEDRWIAARSP